jgi:hypothetical protein
MERLLNRLIQGRIGTLGVIQTQAVHRHELALQGFIQRLLRRLFLSEHLIARYRGLQQRDEIALKFNLSRVEAIAPGELPEALWLSLQSRLPGFSRVSVQENTIAQLPDREEQVRRHIASQRAEGSSSDSENDERSALATRQNSKQILPLRATESNPDVRSKSEMFRVRRVSLHSTDIAEMPSSLHLHPGDKKAIAHARIPPSPQNAVPEDTSAVKPNLESISGSPIEFIFKPTVKSTVRKGFAKESTSQPNRDGSNLHLRGALTDTDISQHLARVHPKRSSPSPLMEIGHSLRIVSKPKNNYLVQPSPDRWGSEAIAVNKTFPLAKLVSNPAIAEPSPEKQDPLPLARPKHHQMPESRDRLAEVEPSADPKNIVNTPSAIPSIPSVAPVIHPINVEKITEQVSKQIFRQLRLERERRGIYL